MSYFSMIPTFTILAMAVTALAAPQPAAIGSSSVESVVGPITVYIPETTVTVTNIQLKTVTTTATVTATPEWCCPTTNRIQNPGFSDQTAWVLERGVTILNADPSGASVENVLLADFTAADQGYMFYQTLKNLCPGQTYNFKAHIQMWKGSGSAHAEFYLGGQMFLKTQSLTVGPWVTVTGTVIASRATLDLRIIVVSGAEAGARSFLMDSFDLSLA